MPVPFNVYEFFRFIIPGGYFVALLYILVSFLRGTPIAFDILSYNTILYFFAALIVSTIIDSRDAIQRSRGWFAEADYFQNQFPSRHLLARCNDCKRNASCPNRLSESNYVYVNTWFYFFNEHVPAFPRDAVLTTGYLCRFVFYVHLFSLLFFYLGFLYPVISALNGAFSPSTFVYSGILLIIVEAVFLANNVGRKGEKPHSIFLRALNPGRLLIAGGLLLGLLKHEHQKEAHKGEQYKPEARGMWRRWKGRNAVLIRWIEMNEPLLLEKICKQSQETVSDPDSQDLSDTAEGKVDKG